MATTKKKSGTPATQKPAKIAYGLVACDHNGAIYSIQSSAGRSEKASLVVRYASIDSLATPGEIICGHRGKLQQLSITADDVCHAVSQDGAWLSSTNAWKPEKLSKQLVSVGGRDELMLASGNGPTLFAKRDNAGWKQEVLDLAAGSIDFFGSFAVLGPDDVYAAGTGGLLHFDGARWSLIAHEAGPKSVAAVSRDEVYVASFSGLFRGNAHSGFERVAEQKLQYSCVFRGELYACAYSGGVFCWRGGKLVSVSAPIAITGLTGSAKLLAASSGMQDGIWLFDGTTWTSAQPA